MGRRVYEPHDVMVQVRAVQCAIEIVERWCVMPCMTPHTVIDLKLGHHIQTRLSYCRMEIHHMFQSFPEIDDSSITN
jgi:hypothetical protein